MKRIVISESVLRNFLRETVMMGMGGGMGTGSHLDYHEPELPVNVSQVVAPDAPETDSANPNFVPQNKMELLSALRMLIGSIEDDQIPGIYIAMNDAVKEKESEMKNSEITEMLIRKVVRKILKEVEETEPGALRYNPTKTSTEKRDAEATKKWSGWSDADRAAAVAAFKQAGNEITVVPSHVFKEPASNVVEKRVEEKISKTMLYQTDFSGTDLDSAASAYRTAYENALENPELASLEPYEIVGSSEFQKEFKSLTGKTLNQVAQAIGIKATDVLAERLSSQIENEIEDVKAESEESEKEKSYREKSKALMQKYMEPEVATEARAPKTSKQNVSQDTANRKLKQLADELKVSVSMIKKIEVIALGKYVLAVKANIHELIPT